MASDWHKQTARTRFILGAVLAEISEDEYAIELFQGALERDPTLVASHVHLALAYGRQGTYQEMLGAFREAILLDTLSVRAAIDKAPEEAELIERLLNPPSPLPASESLVTVMPAQYVQSGKLVHTGMDLIGAGRDEEAIAVLEWSLKIDPELPLAISLLSLAYLLLRKRRGSFPANAKASVLFEIDAALARLIFNS